MLLGNESKRIVAHCLATENIKVIYNEKAKTPSFDSIKRKLTLPNWVVSENIENVIVAHEMAHALFSNFTTKEIKFFDQHGYHFAGKEVFADDPHVGWSYYQIIEDIRIEKLMKRKYAGIKRDFTLGYSELMDQDFFGLKQIEELSLIDKLNVYFKVRYSAPVPFSFTEEEQPFVAMCENVETREDVLDVAKKVFDYCLQKKKEEEKDNRDNEPEYTNSTDQNSRGQPQIVTNNANQSVTSNEDSDGGRIKIESPETQRNFNYELSKTVDCENDPRYYHCPNCKELPIVSYEKLISTIPPIREKYMESVTNYMKSCEESVNVMVQEFMRRKAAKDYQKIKIHKTGTLNSDKLSQYRISEDIFKKIKDVKKGKSHALILCVDWSSSMQYQISETLDQLYRIVLFCRKMNIPHEVYLFSDNNSCNKQFDELFDRNIKSKVDVDMIGIKMNKFTLFNIFSSKMTKMEFKTMLYRMQTQVDGIDTEQKYTMGGTPLDECIVSMNKLVTEYKKDNKIEIMNVIFLTDGDSNPKDWGTKDNNSYIYFKNQNHKIRISPTDTLLRILKQETGANVFGIYLCQYNYGNDVQSLTTKYMSIDEESRAKEQKFMNDNGYFVASNKQHGYDELFVVMGSKNMTRTIKSFDYLIDFTDNKYDAFHLYMIAKSFKSVMLKHFTHCISAYV